MTPLMNTGKLRQLENFRELINQVHPPVCIAGCYFDPADVLEHMDPIAFRMLLDAFLTEGV
jgi:hypothetical protein